MTTNPRIRRLWILSDLHTDATEFALPENPGADALIIPGDIGGRLAGQGRLWLERNLPRDIPTILIPGNHDYYGGDIEREIDEFLERTSLENLWILDGDTLILGGTRFIGGTLWTDFEAYGDGYRSQSEALRQMNDYQRIQYQRRRGHLRPHHLASIHSRHRSWFDQALAQPFDGPTVCISHHAPSTRSLMGGIADEPLDAAYASDLDGLIRAGRPDLWIHGHIHESRDYMLGDTRILANPRGHIFRRGAGRTAIERPENPNFNPGLILDLDDPRPLVSGATIDVAIDHPDAFQWPLGREPQPIGSDDIEAGERMMHDRAEQADPAAALRIIDGSQDGEA